MLSRKEWGVKKIVNGAPVRKKNYLTFFQDTFLEWEYNLNALSRPH